MPDLLLKNISKSFGVTKANQSINLKIKEGEIHALLGENGAGKSTLVKMIYGVLQPDEGEIFWQGQLVKKNSPDKAKKSGIHMIFQHFSLFDSFTVAQNIALSISGKINIKELQEKILNVSKKYGLLLDPKKLVLHLSVSEKQRIEIVRSLIQDPKLLIMDEPTSVLSPLEIETLFSFLKKLSKEGCSILYISHKLEEIMHLCDKATILRQGRVVTECQPKKENHKSLAELMIGKKLMKIKKKIVRKTSKKKFFEVKNLSIENSENNQDIKDVSFTVAESEIFAIAGVSGNGQQTLQEALCGLRLSPQAEQIILQGISLGHLNVKQRRQKKIVFVSEERLGTSAVPDLDLIKNTFLTGYMSFSDYFSKSMLINYSKVGSDTEEIIHNFNVVTENKEAKALSLSGGNLQKFIIGREIYAAPKLLIVVDPTWGVDAGAEKLIHQTLLDLVAEGSSVILISQDLDEIFAISDRVAVLCAGNLSKAYPVNKLDNQKIGLLMGGSKID